MNPPFGSAVIWYLFLGGAGSGTYLISSVVDYVNRRHALSGRDARVRLAGRGRALGLFVMAVGVAFLLFDLGRIDRAYLLITSPTLSIISFGAYAILLFLMSAGYALAIRHAILPELSPLLTRVAEWASVLFAFAVMAYTGLLLSSMQAISLWASPFVLVLFVLSSLSSGAALLAVTGFVLGPERPLLPFLRRMSWVVAVVAVLEILALAAFLTTAQVAAPSSVSLLMSGALAEAFWVGYVACGLALPLLMHLIVRRGAQARLFGTLGVLVLVGGFFLRFCIVSAGFHDAVVAPLGI